MFDIVWFGAEHAEEAMHAVALLDDAERVARGKTHHFRVWEGVPSPIPGKQKFQYCVATDRRGSVLLQPGATVNGELYINDWCTREEMPGGWIGGKILPEFWLQPDVLKEIECDKIREARNVEDAKRFRVEPESRNDLVRLETRRYFITCAHIGGVWSKNLETASEQELFDICQMIDLGASINFPTLQDWLFTKIPPVEEPKPYDPMSFLAHAQKMRGAFVRNKKAS